MIEFRESHKGFKQLFLGVYTNSELSVASKAMDAEFVELISRRLRNQTSQLKEEKLIVSSYIILGMVRSLFMCMTVLDNATWDDLKGETKRAIKIYIEAIE